MIKSPILRLRSIGWQIAAFVVEWSMVMFTLCLLGLHDGYVGSLGVTLLWVVTFKMPRGWNTGDELIYNAKDRLHDCVAPYSIALLAWVILSVVL